MKFKKILAVLFLIPFFAVSLAQAETNNKGYEEIIGRWLRPDGGYILAINGIDEEGKMDAKYLNPRSINVSQAQASIESEQIKIFVELKDRNYDGNYYELFYDKETDRLSGTYYHLGMNQEFDVYFIRQATNKKEEVI